MTSSVEVVVKPDVVQNSVNISAEEVYEPQPDRMDPNLAWFFPAFLYCVVGLDQSMFNLYAKNKQLLLPVRTHKADKPLVRLVGYSIGDQGWFHTLQAIPKEHVRGLIDFIGKFEFRGPPGGVNWGLEFVETRMRDPFADKRGERVGSDVILVLPVDTTHSKRVVVVQGAGIELSDIHLGIADALPR